MVGLTFTRKLILRNRIILCHWICDEILLSIVRMDTHSFSSILALSQSISLKSLNSEKWLNKLSIPWHVHNWSDLKLHTSPTTSHNKSQRVKIESKLSYNESKTIYNDSQRVRNDLQWLTTRQKWFTTTHDESKMIYNDSQRVKNDLQRLTTSQKWFTMTHNESKTISNDSQRVTMMHNELQWLKNLTLTVNFHWLR